MTNTEVENKQIRINPLLHRQIAVQAAAEGVTLKELAETALRAYIAERQVPASEIARLLQQDQLAAARISHPITRKEHAEAN